MELYMKINLYALMGITLTLSVAIGFMQSAQAHGYVFSPTSRTVLCHQVVNTRCGAVQYEPQSVEGAKGFPVHGPQDGTLASGGNTRFSELNQQSPTRWSKVILHPGSNTFNWMLTATHKTTSWRYFITRQGWDASKPLTRTSFDLTPFCQFDGKGQVPTSTVKHNCMIPADRSGYHVILAVWDIADTGNAFYQAIDVNVIK